MFLLLFVEITLLLFDYIRILYIFSGRLRYKNVSFIMFAYWYEQYGLIHSSICFGFCIVSIFLCIIHKSTVEWCKHWFGILNAITVSPKRELFPKTNWTQQHNAKHRLCVCNIVKPYLLFSFQSLFIHSSKSNFICDHILEIVLSFMAANSFYFLQKKPLNYFKGHVYLIM